MRCAAIVTALLACTSATAIDRYAIVVGANQGLPGETPLRYAELDAEKVAQTLRRTGSFAAADVVVLAGESVASMRETLIRLNDRIRRESAGRALLLVYFSGHADADSLHLDGNGLAFAELEALVRGSSARFRVLIVDACRSGAITRVKGGRSIEPFAMPVQADDGEASEGYVVLTAAAAGEDAQESDALQGSFFTHHLVSGLLGAADRDADGTVTLDEAYGYTFARTVMDSSATLAGTQHPTFRYDLRGKGDVALSRLRGGSLSTLTLPSGAGFLVFFADAVVAEIPIDAVRRSLAVAPGRYFVRGRAKGALYEGHVDIATGTTRAVTFAELQRVDYARLVRKGAAELPVIAGPELAYAGHTPWVKGGAMQHGAELGFPIVLQYLTVTPRVHLSAGGWSSKDVSAVDTEASLAIEAVHSFDLPFVSFEAGLAVGAVAVRQDFSTRGSAPPRTSYGPTLGAVAGATVPLPAGLHAGVAATATSAILPISEAPSSGAWSTPAVFGWRIAFGSTF